MRSKALSVLLLVAGCAACGADKKSAEGVERFSNLSSYIVTADATIRAVEPDCIKRQGVKVAIVPRPKESSHNFGSGTVSGYFLRQTSCTVSCACPTSLNGSEGASR
jgi:hypothetical protein